MKVLLEKEGSFSIVTLPSGALDAQNAESFKLALEPLLAAGAEILVDLHKVSFMDSSGLGALVVCLRRTLANGGDLEVCSPQTPVRVLFEVVRAHQIFSIYNNRQEAFRERQVHPPAIKTG